MSTLGWRKFKPATGPYRVNGNSVAQTFDEFLEDQRIRVTNKLRPPINEHEGRDWRYDGQDYVHPRARANDGLSRVRVHAECEQEMRGRV